MVKHLAAALPQSLLEGTGALAVFGLGVLVGSGVHPSPSDWLGFVGALMGASLTVAGSVYVLDRERRRQADELIELLDELLGEVIDTCTPFQMANELALERRHGRTALEQARLVHEAVDRLKAAKDVIQPSTARMIKIARAIDALQVDQDLEAQAVASGRYKNSGGDFGGLNAIGHDVTRQAEKIRVLLRA